MTTPLMPLQKLDSQTLPWPTDWTALFGVERPLILEIGFGYGDMLLHLAETRPDRHIIGLEISNRCLTTTEARIERRGLRNVRVIHTQAMTALHHLFVPDSLSEVHINFPDPWFKSRHEHRRLMQPATVDVLVSRMQEDARLYLATDILDYADMVHELLSETPGLDNLLETPWAESMSTRIPTKYERKARRAHRDCYYFAYRRNAVPAPLLSVLKELAMPHVVLHSPLTLEAMRAAFTPIEFAAGEAHVHIQFVYIGERSLLFDVYVKEPTIDQRVALSLVARETPQEYTLQLSMLGHPRPTAGVHAATNRLTDWLLSLHPDATILKRKTQETE